MPREAKPWFRSGEGAWYVRYKGRQVSLRVRGRQSEAAAWRAFDALKAGGPPASGAQVAQPAPGAVGAALSPQGEVCAAVTRAFLDDAAGRVTGGTLELYRLFLHEFDARFGATRVDALSSPAVEALSRRPNWNPSTRAAFLAVVGRAFRFAERARLVARSPLRDLKRPAIASRAADVVLTRAQLDALCGAAPGPFREFLEFVWLTGCRPSEAAQLTAADVDLAAGTATVRHHKTAHKGKRRVLYLAPAAVALLRGLAERHPTGPLLRNRVGAPWRKATLGAAMRKARERAGLPGKILYGLRHAWITDALAAGVSDAVVASLAGHSSTATIHRHYNHIGTRAKLLGDAAAKVRGE